MTDSLQAPAPVSAASVPESEALVETHPSVRELLTELAALEDATRLLGPAGAPVAGATPEQLAALAREQEIIAELHRRCPDEPAS